MFLQPQLKTLMRDGSEGAERHDARNLQESWRKFAAFAYVAEQYGYRYYGLSPTSPKGSPNPYFAFRRAPDAVERASRTAALFPQALTGGQLPGMRPGGSRLRPLTEARREVDLLHARIQVDYNGSHRGRGLLQLLVIPLVMLIPLSQTGFTPHLPAGVRRHLDPLHRSVGRGSLPGPPPTHQIHPSLAGSGHPVAAQPLTCPVRRRVSGRSALTTRAATAGPARRPQHMGEQDEEATLVQTGGRPSAAPSGGEPAEAAVRRRTLRVLLVRP